MKALVLCAGKGTRLMPLTLSIPKHLIPIVNKPILFYGLEEIAKAGIVEVGIVVSDWKSEIEKVVGDGTKWGLKVTYIRQPEPQGLAHAVWVSKDFIGDDPFLVYLGDNLLLEGLSDFVSRFRDSKEKINAMILLKTVDNPSQFGVAETDREGKILKLVEKPEHPASNLAITGVYAFDKTIFQAIETLKPSKRGEYELTDALQYLLDNNFSMNSTLVDKWWKDTGKPADIIEANRFILETIVSEVRGEVDDKSKIIGRVKIGANTNISNSTIRGPVAIGENCRITNSFIGAFTSIGNNVHIRHSEVEYSVVMENCKLFDVDGRIDDSLLGRNVEIIRITQKPKVYKFIHADNSRTELC